MPVKRLASLFAVLVALGAALATSATGAERMWVGFHDDPSLRFDGGRQAAFQSVRAHGATIARTLVEWHRVAPTKPANASDSFDPAYKWDDLDEYVRNAQTNGIEVLMTLWGTPAWANGDQKPPFLPTDMADFQAFATAIASRYSGRNPGLPFVRFFGIWNESNLATFLQPQFDAAGKIVSPANYARLAAAGYTGVKAGNALAQVGVGETSSNGRDKRKPGQTDTIAPATFAKGVAAANPNLKFDAWAHHPYPVPVNQKPTQKVRYPNVALLSLPKFEEDLDTWFKRKKIPIWISEYGNETQPGEPKGISEAQQAAFIPQAITLLRADPRVRMFVWFVFRDSAGSPWQSGLYASDGRAKPGDSRFTSSVTPLDARNATMTVKSGKRPVAVVYLREFCANNPAGTKVGSTIRVFLKTKLVGVSQVETALLSDCTVKVQIPFAVKKKTTYTATVDANTANGNAAKRTLVVVGA
jgi:hypothetical protein